jgi:hypothetical protein
LIKDLSNLEMRKGPASGPSSSPRGFHAGGWSLRLGEDTGHEKMKTIYPSIPATFERKEM